MALRNRGTRTAASPAPSQAQPASAAGEQPHASADAKDAKPKSGKAKKQPFMPTTPQQVAQLYHEAVEKFNRLVRRKSAREMNVLNKLPEDPPGRHIPYLAMPAHAKRDSLLSSTSHFDDFRGVYNLALIVLFVFGIRIAAENYMRYGLLVDLSFVVEFFDDRNFPGLYLLILMHLQLLVALGIEKLASKGLPSSIVAFCNTINIATLLLLPCVVSIQRDLSAVVSALVLFKATIISMKLVSYSLVNNHWRNVWLLRDVRNDLVVASTELSHAAAASRATSRKPSRRTSTSMEEMDEDESANQGEMTEAEPGPSTMLSNPIHSDDANDDVIDEEEDDDDDDVTVDPWVEYPNNLTVSNILFFLCVPTLCYELNYPRTQRIRKSFLLRRSFEVIILLILIVSLAQQWIVPTVNNAFTHEIDIPLSELIFRTLKLSVPNNIVCKVLFRCIASMFCSVRRCPDFLGVHDVCAFLSLVSLFADLSVAVVSCNLLYMRECFFLQHASSADQYT
eukprot:m.305474 g.305474  ORF g.305474 m.305474 type:complete len:508 (+) comp15907_c0_seq12:376-1899(+)